MKAINLLTVFAVLVVILSACNQKSTNFKNAQVKTEADSVALSLGYSVGTNLKGQFAEINPEILGQAIVDAFNEVENPLFATMQDADMAIRVYLRKQSEQNAEEGLENEPETEKNEKRSNEIKTEADSIAIALGYSLGENVKSEFSNVNPQLVAKGIVEAFDGLENPLFETPKDADMAIRAYMRKESERKAEENLKIGQAFLEENAKREGVFVTESGLQYEIIKDAEGPKPSETSTVEVHYHGTTIEGVVFDSSVDRGETIEFPLNGVISGWTEGLQLMSVGSKYKFYIPSDLAYGPRAASAAIGPNSTLIFEVELFNITN